jgi:hypothetical protein
MVQKWVFLQKLQGSTKKVYRKLFVEFFDASHNANHHIPRFPTWRIQWNNYFDMLAMKKWSKNAFFAEFLWKQENCFSAAIFRISRRFPWPQTNLYPVLTHGESNGTINFIGWLWKNGPKMHFLQNSYVQRAQKS